MTPQAIVELLNDLLATDPAAMHSLVGMAVPVNEAMLSHPTAMCRVRNSLMQFPTFGVLGLLSTIVQMDGPFVVEAIFDDATHCIREFKVGKIDAPQGATC
jgi:hypothetical protein